MTACTFVKPWQGECGDAGTGDPPRCEEHTDLECGVCGAPAVTRCKASFGMMCGNPLCEDCDLNDCDFHPQ